MDQRDNKQMHVALIGAAGLNGLLCPVYPSLGAALNLASPYVGIRYSFLCLC